MGTHTSLHLEAGVALPGEAESLAEWTTANLAPCEDWLTRRGLLALVDDLLPAFRARAAADTSGSRRAAESSHTPAVRPPVTDPQVLELVAALGDDLSRYYSNSLAHGGITRIVVIPIEGVLTPLLNTGEMELFAPRRYLERVREHTLFAAVDHFSEPVSATSSWLFFQSLVLGGAAVQTAAQHLNIRESA